ncbi:MAG: hypothetical protein RIQ56_466 [Candidatus Parcubacteria bacterium]|jgi:hypothetical protein
MTESADNSPKPRIPRGRAYRERFRDLASDKIAIARDEKGAPLWDIFETAKEIEGEFLNFKSFVGVSLRGSKMRGYAKRSWILPSDVDMIVVYDPLTAPEEGIQIKEKADQLTTALSRRFTKIGGPPLSLSTQILPSGNSYQLLSFIEPQEGQVITDQQRDFARSGSVVRGMATMCEHMRGPKVELYRKKIREALQQLAPARRKMMVERLISIQLIYEQERLKKMRERIPEAFPPGQDLEYFYARELLWRARITKMFGEGAPQPGRKA